MFLNPILATDFYKVGHKDQYPEGTEVIYSNFTPRSDRLAMKSSGYPGGVVFAGLQAFIKWFLMHHFQHAFFDCPREMVVGEYKRVIDKALGVDFDATHIGELWDLRYLPLEIKALPEGSIVPCKVPVLTVKNTNPKFFWLTNYFETAMSAELWKFINNATIAFQYRAILEYWADKTGSPKDFVLWQGHDFSMRGMSGVCDSALNGVSHLMLFLGTDTIPAINSAELYYNAIDSFVGGSVPATEHSVMCAGGQDGEVETFRRLLKKYPTGVVSIVSDTWDFWNIVTNTAKELKDEIMNRQPNAVGLAKTVFRPDSGDPVEILCGEEVMTAKSLEHAEEILKYHGGWEEGEDFGPPYASALFRINGETYKVAVFPEWSRYDKRFYFIDGWGETAFEKVELTPAEKGAVECLWEIFGGTVTDKGYKLLDSHVGLIYGDSITLERAEQIMKRLAAKGFASANVVLGIGSYTYQYSTRDCFGQAMKATYAVVNGEGRELFKDPVTDSGTKKSAKGLLKVSLDSEGKYFLEDQVTPEQEAEGCLRTVYKDGNLLVDESLDEIRQRLNAEVQKQVQKMKSKA